MKKNILNYIMLLMLACVSCSIIHKDTKMHFTYCYDGTYSGLDTLLSLNGYFDLEILFYDEQGNVKSSTKRPLVFFDDGTFVYESWLIHMEKEVTQTKKCEYDGYGWGIYKLYNDTIWTQNFAVSSSTSSCRKFVFKIIDKENIECLYAGYDIDIISKEYIEKYALNKKSSQFTKASFIECNNLPSQSCSTLMKKKWFWCNEEEYIKWKKGNR